MKEITRTETLAVKQTPAVELSRMDLEIAIRDYLIKKGYPKLTSLAHFHYKDGVVENVTVDIEK